MFPFLKRNPGFLAAGSLPEGCWLFIGGGIDGSTLLLEDCVLLVWAGLLICATGACVFICFFQFFS